MTARRYELAIIPCTRAKNPLGVTPLTLYRSTPFSVMIKHAQQRCGRILIMSAKYGLLRPDDRITNYDVYLPQLRPEERAKLRGELCSQWRREKLVEVPPEGVLSYLPKAYYDFLAETSHFADWAPRIRRPYKSLSLLKLVEVLSNEIKGFETPGLARR